MGKKEMVLNIQFSSQLTEVNFASCKFTYICIIKLNHLFSDLDNEKNLFSDLDNEENFLYK